MKLICVLLLSFVLLVARVAAQSISSPMPSGSQQWIELPQQQGGESVRCDLARAAHVKIIGDRAVAVSSFPTPQGQAEAYSLLEDDLAIAQAVLQAVQSQPARWLRVDVAQSAKGEYRFINLAMMTAVRYGADAKGDFARVYLCGESIMQTRVASKDPSAGYEVRDKEDITRLKGLSAPSH